MINCPRISVSIHLLFQYEVRSILVDCLLTETPIFTGMSAGLLKPCCLGVCGGVDSQGKPMFTVCEDPAKQLFWDAIHPSQAGWIAVTKNLFPNANLGPFS